MSAMLPIVFADSIAEVPAAPLAQGVVVISGSHGGISAASLAVRWSIHGVIFNDAGVGKEQAGIAGIHLLERYGVYAAVVDAFSARIGSAEETARGRISFANRRSFSVGVLPGMQAEEAAHLMACAPRFRSKGLDPVLERALESHILYRADSGHRVVAIDSNSMITAENSRDIVFTGSHGGLVGTRPAVRHPVIAAFYNDAGVGKDGAGFSRLPWLDRAGIIAATVSADSARIGLGLDTYHCGVLSHVNGCAAELGIQAGMRAQDAARLILQEVSLHSRNTISAFDSKEGMA